MQTSEFLNENFVDSSIFMQLIFFFWFTDRGRGDLFWKIQLDQDLVDTISSIYPDWFRQQQQQQQQLQIQNQQQQQQQQLQQQQQHINPLTMQNSVPQPSPPSAEVDESPLQKSMDKNKECE